MVAQTTLYEFIGLQDDPVFNLISKMHEGDEIQIDSFAVRKTDKFYEVESGEYHEPFKTIDKCYLLIASKI